MLHNVGSVVSLDTFPFFPSLLCGCYLGERGGGEKFACVEFWVSFGEEKTGGEGNGVNKRGSYFFFFFFLPWGNLLQTAKSHYNTLAAERRVKIRGETGWVRKTFSRLM